MKYGRILRPFQISSDLIFLNITFLLAFFVYAGLSLSSWNNRFLLILLMFNISWLISSFFMGLYTTSRTIRTAKLLTILFRSFVLFFLMIQTFITLGKFFTPRTLTVLLVISSMIGISFSQMIFSSLIRFFRSTGRNSKPIIILGYGDLSMYLRRKIGVSPEFGYRYMGFFDDLVSSNKSLGKIGDVIPFLKDNQIEEIYCYPTYIDPIKLQEVVHYAEDNLITVKVIPDYRGYQYSDMGIEMIDDIPVLRLRPLPLEDDVNRFWKRTFDIIMSLFAFLFIFSWLFPIVALAIKLNSKGPVLFKQKRGGRGNKSFMIYKFRTMYLHDEKQIKQASKTDSRITKVGSFLRKSSIDEIPQLINVFLGTMSIVGPRPHALRHNIEFRKQIERFNERHAVKPGITGLAQAKGYRGEIQNQSDLVNRIKFDRFYVKKWSLTLDIRIILLTIFSLIKGQDTAY